MDGRKVSASSAERVFGKMLLCSLLTVVSVVEPSYTCFYVLAAVEPNGNAELDLDTTAGRNAHTNGRGFLGPRDTGRVAAVNKAAARDVGFTREEWQEIATKNLKARASEVFEPFVASDPELSLNPFEDEKVSSLLKNIEEPNAYSPLSENEKRRIVIEKMHEIVIEKARESGKKAYLKYLLLEKFK
ncbi:unnamed protein product [Amoebophrya sp. A120]|nr:unnamed protein product [Amoebophrya sp. A120]|eukprot:GSA120T00000441001.1